jgi:two-component system, NarL family, nitrate/nitrite response regulator NarL
MTRSAAKEPTVAPVSQEYLCVQAEEWLKRLVEHIEGDAEGGVTRVLRRTSELVEEVIFETTIDGTSYYLVRCQSQGKAQINLSPRELAIARLIAKGMPNKCIGDVLEISPWTVSTHLRRIFVKLGVTSRAAMVARLGGENLL